MIEHMESENRHEFDATIETFDHPRYELIATGDVYDGEAEVARYFERDADRVPRPAQRADRPPPLRRRGDRRGDAATAPTGLVPRPAADRAAAFEMRFCAMFVFEEDRLVCERVYFDAATVLRQLGIAHDPLTLRGRVATVVNHPLTVGAGPQGVSGSAAERSTFDARA